MNRATAQALAAACRRILEIEEDWESIDIRNLDVDDILLRFKNLKQKEYTPASLKVYESRFRRALDSFENYIEDPSDWSYSTRRPSPKKIANKSKTDQQSEPSSQTKTKEEQEGSHAYLYPFRPDFMARLEIPRDATVAEVERLIAWARTLAIDYSPEQ